LHLRLGVGDCARGIVEILLRDHARLEQPLVAPDVELVPCQRDLRAREARRRPFVLAWYSVARW